MFLYWSWFLIKLLLFEKYMIFNNTTVNPVLLAAASNTVMCCQNEGENAKVGVRL